ncbi:MAG TPA: response regulator transcription factor [Polyangiaceae bacterium]|jgi:DNA-binding response OmpR family regulator|nr:response regulator transcription factor [Polyangiaceae bacterium]
MTSSTANQNNTAPGAPPAPAASPTGAASGKRILVIEDDASIVLGLRMNLEAEGYVVQVAEDGEAGLAQARGDQADLIILDIMLPKLNGFEVLRQLRAEGVGVPTIVLSARDAELDIVMGLEFGAEDYVTKPFGIAELLARIKAVLRRPARGSSGERSPAGEANGTLGRDIRVGELEIDPRTRQVTRGGEVVALTATEFEILWCLVQAEGRVLAREEIQVQVWGPGHHGTLRTIDNFMMQLRTKLERDPGDPQHLLTVRGVGYRLKP